MNRKEKAYRLLCDNLKVLDELRACLKCCKEPLTLLRLNNQIVEVCKLCTKYYDIVMKDVNRGVKEND